ncbi:MAG: redoxin domain-containing protein [Myxococcales bacterium]|nr:redoxin domain-containing protein [Myxococcales bacterium]
MSRGGVILSVGLACVVGLVAVLASGFQHDPHEVASPLVNKPAPDFTLSTIELNAAGGADTVRLSGQRGTPVVVNFWATWCVPCQQEHQTLLALAARFRGTVRFYGVVYQDKPEAIDAWLNKRGRGYPTLIDAGSQAAIAFGVYGVPETFVIDQSGIIREKSTGGVNFQQLSGVLDELLGGRG